MAGLGGISVIKDSRNHAYGWLVPTAKKQSALCDVHCPEVGILASKRREYFSTGLGNGTLVVISTGLLEDMGKEAIKMMVADEVRTIAKGGFGTFRLKTGIFFALITFWFLYP